MGSVLIHAGVLRREHEYYGSKTIVPGKGFDSTRIVNPVAGYLDPYNDQGLGLPTTTLNFTQNQGSSSKVGVDFEYYINQSTKERYFITCNSVDFFNAYSTDNVLATGGLANLVVATGSGYAIRG